LRHYARHGRVPCSRWPGYGARNGQPSEGVKDPLQAKVLYLRDNDIQTAIIACDLRSITPEIKSRVVEQVSDLGLSKDSVLVCASHNHSGPSFYREKFWQLQFGIFDPEILDPMADSIAAAVREAHASAKPVSVGFARGIAEGFHAQPALALRPRTPRIRG
jgi:predicted neutral ceramidase superfamily lipid hydrolase